MQQQELGEGIYGVVGITAMCTWAWETDWTVSISWQRSGATVWRHAKMEGVPDPDVGEALRQLVAEAMGYV